MDSAELLTVIEKGGPVPPVLFFGGREDFLKERLIVRMAATWIADADRADNLRRFDLATSGAVAEFIGALDSFSFNEARRLFVLANPEEAAAEPRKQVWARLAAGLSPDVTVVVSSVEKEIGAALKKALGERLGAFDFWAPFPNKMPGWVEDEARHLGCLIEAGAVELLLNRIGSDLRLLHQELAKLAVSAVGRKVTRAQVDQAVAWSRDDQIFDLIDQIGQRRLGPALATLQGLWQRGEAPMAVWSALVRTLREYRVLHEIALDRPDVARPLLQHLTALAGLHGRNDFRSNQERKRLQGEVKTVATGWPAPLREALRLQMPMQPQNLALATRFKLDELTRLWPRLLRIDLALKSSPPDARLVLERLLIEVIQGKPGRPTHGDPFEVEPLSVEL